MLACKLQSKFFKEKLLLVCIFVIVNKFHEKNKNNMLVFLSVVLSDKPIMSSWRSKSSQNRSKIHTII